ncbi:MAG: hypothetical protein JRH20_32250, partial [Deltaproteobacteria bacterium]|nr:hypothetical protein [Deltaproteobacteria bacterium]
ASASVPGVGVSINPPTLTLAPGEQGFFTVTFTVTPSAALDTWAFGSLVWADATHVVRSPIAVRPTALQAPAALSGTGTAGSTNYEITFGFAGDFTAAPHGLAAAQVQAGTVVDDPANDINVALGSDVGITVHAVTIPAGSLYARFSLFDSETDGVDDLDLYVFGPTGAFVGGSGSGTSAEQVNAFFPAAGTYFVIVHGWQTDGADANYLLSSWAVPMAAAGNMNVNAPTTATLGGTANVQLDWNGLESDTRYLGMVSYSTSGFFVDATVVDVSTK